MAWDLLTFVQSPMRLLMLFALVVLGTTDAHAEAYENSLEYAVEGVIVPGSHTRLDTIHGAVHVWAPDGYVAETATLVVYVHGYFVEVDDAWWAHGLPEQFGASGINALFVVPESPSGSSDSVRWESITDLALTIEGMIDVDMPKGRRVVIGHSGAYRTLAQWVSDPKLDTVVMLDAGYGHHEPFIEWARKGASHRLISISVYTVWWGNWLHKHLPSRIVEVARLGPKSLEAYTRDRIVHVRCAGLDHWQVVTTALPATLRMLRATPLPPAPGLPPGATGE